MNKRILIAALCCLLLIPIGCAQQPSPSDEPQHPSSSQTEPVEQPPEPPQEASADNEPQLPLMVADAAMYRGTVVELTTSKDGVIITLRQPVGVDFGAPKVKFYITENTRLSFARELLTTGEFLEVHYGRQGQPDEAVQQAIVVNRYFQEEAVNFNGTVLEYLPSTEKPGAGTLRMRELASGQVIWYHFDESTQFYLNTSALQAGDKLNIFHRGIFALSEPPQGYALEVRSYHETKAYPSTGVAL